MTNKHAKQNKCFQMMKAYDKHGEATMESTYVCSTAEEDAEYGEYIFKEVYGEPVQWPSQEDLVEMRRNFHFEEADGEDCVKGEQDEDEEDEDGEPDERPGIDEDEEEETPEHDEFNLSEADVLEAIAAEAQLPTLGSAFATSATHGGEDNFADGLGDVSLIGSGSASSGLIREDDNTTAEPGHMSVEETETASCRDDPWQAFAAGGVDDLEVFNGDSFTSVVLQQTISEYTEDDTIYTAAVKMEHMLDAMCTTKAWSKPNPTLSRGVGETNVTLVPKHSKKAMRWPQLLEPAPTTYIGSEAPFAPPADAAPAPSREPPIAPVPAPAQEVAPASKGKGRIKGASKGKTPEDIILYAPYDPPEGGSGLRKHYVPPQAHAWMEAALWEWQNETGANPWEKPLPNKWYWDRRLECINAGLITCEHSWDVVRSWLKLVCDARKPRPKDAD